MNKRQRIIISIVGITIVLLALLGLTYAYYLTRIQGNTNTTSISVTTADLKLVYDDGSDGVIGGELLEPSDEEFTKTFTVYNDGNVNIDYGVYLIDVVNTFERKDDIKYTMECSTNGTEPCGKVETATTFPSGISELVTATIEPKKTHTYTFSFTYKDTGTDQSVDMNKTLQAKIQIFGKNNNGLIIPYETNTLAFNILNNGADITLTTTTGNFIGDSMCGMDESTCVANVAAGCPGTCYEPGSEVTTTETKNTKIIKTTVNIDNIANGTSWDEELKDYTNDGLFSTEDDYGISYYYRGPVSNNYVTFSNKCWRIVRIDGNGNTKLILEDQDEVCSTTMNGNWDIEASDGTNITTDGTNPYRTGNFGYDDSTGKYKMSYLNPVDNPNRAMVNAFKYFQTNTLTNKITSTYTGKTISDFLVSGNWCLNNKAYSDSTGTTLLENPTYTSTFYYDSYVRLSGKTTKEPTLKCPVEPLYKFDDNQDGVISSNETDMYVGTLTADEIVYAGGKVSSNNPNYYLINKWQNSNSKYFWSLSPYRFGSTSVDAFYLRSDGYGDGDFVDFNYAFRPAVSLVSSAVITSGEGTLESPYIIG